MKQEEAIRQAREIVKFLESAGYKVIIGADNVKQAIKDTADYDGPDLCSGFKVFPDGEKCSGCPDCTIIE